MGQPTFLYTSYSPLAAVTANSSASGYTAADVLSATEDTGHKPSASGNVIYTLDCATARSVSALAILGENFAGLNSTIEGSDNGTDWTDLEAAPVALDLVLNAAWRACTSASHRYFRVTIFAAPSNLLINHLCLCNLVEWPYLEEDWDADNLQVEGEHLFSAAGYFVGGTTQAAMRSLPIAPGVVTASDYAPIKAFADAVIRNSMGCFFLPDVATTEIYFGVIDGKTFAAPYKSGAREVAPMTFKTRAI